MTQVEKLAAFVARATFEDLLPSTLEQLKIRILDSLGCAIGALGAEPVTMVGDHVAAMGGQPHCTLIGGGRTAPDRAAFYNGALVRYLDYNDSYLAPGETCHPSDNLAAVLAAAEYAGASGADLLVALAVAYQIQCRLSDEAPIRARGFDHVTHLAYAAAAGVAKVLGLDQPRIASAVAIAGTAFNALRVTRTGFLSHWKGLAAPNAGFGATHAALLAARGITGPPEVFEGNKGFVEAIAGAFSIDWEAEGLDRVERTILKRYNAEIHSQSTIEAVLDLKREHEIDPRRIARIEIDTFEVAFHIIGGGEEGEKKTVHTKEEADHSLPYLVAVALLDGQVLPAQYEESRIRAQDVQTLLRRVGVRPDPEYSRRFPEEMTCRVVVTLDDDRRFETLVRDYEGFLTRPMRWPTVVAKFNVLAAPHAGPETRQEIVAILEELERRTVSDLLAPLEMVRIEERNP